jgi:hypothetical protein
MVALASIVFFLVSMNVTASIRVDVATGWDYLHILVQAAAFLLGTTARRTRVGRAGIIVAAIALLLGVIRIAMLTASPEIR